MMKNYEDNNPTRLEMYAAMKELLSAKPLSKIAVSEITSRCGLSRKSFYYHFQDKYELVQRMFETEFLAKLQQKDIENPRNFIYELCCYFYANRNCYVHALEDRGQNNFSDYLTRLTGPYIEDYYEMELLCGDYSEEFTASLIDSFISFITMWLRDWPYVEPDDFVTMLHNNLLNISRHSSKRKRPENNPSGRSSENFSND